MNSNLRLITAALSLGLSVAVLVMLVVSNEVGVKLVVMLLALGMAAQSIALIDQVGEKKEQDEENNQEG
ncbi:MAG: hypothetical protein II532_01200 [Bacteroidales bacterium]|jgi:hypothetical protein|nr:hypothetical protein [Bacteroidales bacterium]